MAKREELQSVLEDIKNQIAAFDQKSGILLAAVGIIYALLLDFSLVFSNDWFTKSESPAKTSSLVFFFLMMGFGLISIVLFVLAIVPRFRKNDFEKHPNYYWDISKMNEKEFGESFEKYSQDDDVLKKQILDKPVFFRLKLIDLSVTVHNDLGSYRLNSSC